MSSLLPPLLVLARRFLPAAAGCLAIGVGWHATLALANPTAGVVVSGNASFPAPVKSLTVTSSPGAIINWQSFSIGAADTTRFQQQSAASAVLNRVRDVDPTMILGTLTSNGKVFVITQNGAPFSPSIRSIATAPLAPQIPPPSYVPLAAPLSAGRGSNGMPLVQSTLKQHPVSLHLAKREATF